MRLALAACVVLSAAQEPSSQPAPLDASIQKERWRESLALDLPREVLSQGEALTAPGATLARDGEALALVSRALFAARQPAFESAWKWLADREVTAETLPDVELERARLLIEHDELTRALMLLLPQPQSTEPRYPERPESWLYAGRAWVRSGDAQRAAPLLARFLELAPRDREAPGALHLLAQDALQRGDGATAQRCVARAEELSKWHALWRVRVTQVREHPLEPLPRLGLAQLWLQAGEYARAEQSLRELVARHPEFAAGWFHLGEAERLSGDLAAALEPYDRALALEPDHVLARNNRGTLHRLAGRLDLARADFERIVDGPRSSERTALPAHLSLARVLAANGDDLAAQRRYARYVELGGREPLAEPKPR